MPKSCSHVGTATCRLNCQATVSVGTALAAVRIDAAGTRKGSPYGINRCKKLFLKIFEKGVDKWGYRCYYIQAVSDTMGA